MMCLTIHTIIHVCVCSDHIYLYVKHIAQQCFQVNKLMSNTHRYVMERGKL
jgi:hypothetical protein